MNVNIKIFTPFIILLSFQIIGYLLYDGIKFHASETIDLQVLSMYLVSFISLFVFFILSKNNNSLAKISQDEGGIKKKTSIIVVISALLLLVRPTIVLYYLGSEIGFDSLRTEFFTNYSIRQLVYGHLFIEWFTNQYYVYFMWFYIIYISINKDRFNTRVFYLLILLMVLYNMAYGGRFNIYYALIAIYFRGVLNGDGLYKTIR